MGEMSEFDFDLVDVFAEAPYDGNPLAVVYGGRGLRTEQMQAIAREVKAAETAFPTPVDEERYDVRIFTPVGEVAFAGTRPWGRHGRCIDVAC